MQETKKNQEELIKIIAEMTDEQCRRVTDFLEDSEAELVELMWRLSQFEVRLEQFAAPPSVAAFDRHSDSRCRQLNLLAPASNWELH